MLDILISLVFVLIHLVGWGATIHLRKKFLRPQFGQEDLDPGHFWLGSIWPIYLPIFLTFMAGMGRIKLLSLPKREHHLFKGVAKPSTTLAHLIAKKILQSPEKLTRSPAWIDGPVTVDFYSSLQAIYYVEINEVRYYFDDREKQIICKAAKKADEINKQREAAKVLYDHEMKACDAIEMLMLTKEPPAPTLENLLEPVKVRSNTK